MERSRMPQHDRWLCETRHPLESICAKSCNSILFFSVCVHICMLCVCVFCGRRIRVCVTNDGRSWGAYAFYLSVYQIFRGSESVKHLLMCKFESLKIYAHKTGTRTVVEVLGCRSNKNVQINSSTYPFDRLLRTFSTGRRGILTFVNMIQFFR